MEVEQGAGWRTHLKQVVVVPPEHQEPDVRTAEFPSLCHVQYTPGQWNTSQSPEEKKAQ
jgi:hypothetical protein